MNGAGFKSLSLKIVIPFNVYFFFGSCRIVGQSNYCIHTRLSENCIPRACLCVDLIASVLAQTGTQTGYSGLSRIFPVKEGFPTSGNDI